MPELIFAEVNEIVRDLCRSSCAEVHPCRSSITRSYAGCCPWNPALRFEFFSGGDYPIDAFIRMNWNSTKTDDQIFPSDDKCQLEPFCVSMSPSDLKTFRITWKAK